MKATMWLRIAAVLTLVHAALHTAGGVFGKVAAGPASVAVEAMKSNQFVWMGNLRSFWDFYRGMGLAVAIFLAFEAIVFWTMASLAKSDASRLRPMIAVFIAAYIAMAVNSYLYFFLAPVITELLIAGSLGFAWLQAGKSIATEQPAHRMAAR
jgi:hypothetical protein